MNNQQPCRTSPPEGFSVAQKVMEDAVVFYLANGGPAVARAHVEDLAGDLKFYQDCTEAYRLAMARITAAEKEERQRAEERQEEQQRNLMMSVMGAIQSGRQAKPSAGRNAADGGAAGRNAADGGAADGEVKLPAKLSTEKAMCLWRLLQKASLIDANYQPIGLTRSMMAIIADEMMELLADENEKLMGVSDKWIHFEKLWNMSNLRIDHYHNVTRGKLADFRAAVHALLAESQSVA